MSDQLSSALMDCNSGSLNDSIGGMKKVHASIEDML